MITIKTYAVHGLSEWYGDLKAGTISVKVSFTGGTASPSGALPAYFMSKDPITQFVIENSKEFKSGFIRLEMQQTIADKHPQEAVAKPASTPAPAKAEKAPAAKAEKAPAAKAEAENAPADGGEATDTDIETVQVANKADAIEWLKEHYPEKGYTASKLRTQTALDAACAECKVQFEFTA